jgi:hypothetical protein
MRFRGTSGGAAHTARTAAAVAVAGVLAFASAPPAARAADPSVAPYGQVAAVGALDTGAVYLPDSTSGLTEGDFVDPVGMTATADPSVPGGEDIYVLDLVNPQAMNSLIAGGDQDTVALQYRLQKIAIAPSTTSGSDAGSETVEACTTFTLQSTSAAPDERAVSLAVDGPLNAVDVLINAMPDSFGAVSGYSIAEQVDQWTTSLGGGAPGTCPQTATPTVAVPSTSLDKAHDSGLDGDIDGDSIAFAGTGTSAELTLGGSEYLNAPLTSGISRTEPIIELFTSVGAVDGKPWKAAESAADALAKSAPITGKQSANGWGIDQNSILKSGSADGGYGDVLYALSANPDGSLNVTLGPQEYLGADNFYDEESGADFEPIMATVSADLTTTTPILPSPQTSPTYGYPAGWTAGENDPEAGDVNSEVAATDAAEQDLADGGNSDGSFLAPAGGTLDGGTLAPSVVALAGDGEDFPEGLYAGFVTDDLGGVDGNLDQFGNTIPEPAWTTPNSTVGGETANIGIRVFTGCGSPGDPCASGDPVGMIGDATSGPCSVRSGGYGFGQDADESTLALATGSGGTIYALAQPDLDSASGTGISPGHPVSGANVGDILFEFKPGAGIDGNPGSACPQPSGDFSVTDLSAPGATASTGTGTVQVLAGATIQFDATPLDLQGGVPWSYTWDSATGEAPVSAAFSPDQSSQVYDRADPTQTFVYTTPGQDTATLQMQSDFGPTTVSRPIDVVAPGAITAQLTAAGAAVAGQPTALSASGTTVAAPDSIVDYHWDFGNGTSDDTAGPSETWTFPSAGTYTVTLTAIDQVGRTQTASEQVPVAPAPAPAPPAPAATGTTAPTTTPIARVTHRFSVSPRFRSVRRNTALSARLACPAGDRTCAGTIAVLTAGRVTVPGRKGKHVISLGKGTFSVAAGHSKTVLVHLATVTQRLIAPGQDLKLSVVVIAHDAAGAHSTQRISVFLFPPRKSRPRKFG